MSWTKVNRPNPATDENIIHHDQAEFISGMQECLNIQKSANIMDHTKNIEEINNQLSSYRVTAQQNSSIHLCKKLHKIRNIRELA